MDVEAVGEALVLLARRGQVPALVPRAVGRGKALGRPVMDYARAELRGRVAGWLDEQYLRWLHPTSGRRPGEAFL